MTELALYDEVRAIYLAQREMLGEEGAAHMSVDEATRLYGYPPIAVASSNSEINREHIRCRLRVVARAISAKSERVMDDAQAKEFQACACFAIKLAEEAEDFASRDNLLTLIRAWLAAAKDVQSSVDEVRLSSGIR